MCACRQVLCHSVVKRAAGEFVRTLHRPPSEPEVIHVLAGTVSSLLRYKQCLADKAWHVIPLSPQSLPVQARLAPRYASAGAAWSQEVDMAISGDNKMVPSKCGHHMPVMPVS